MDEDTNSIERIGENASLKFYSLYKKNKFVREENKLKKLKSLLIYEYLFIQILHLQA